MTMNDENNLLLSVFADHYSSQIPHLTKDQLLQYWRQENIFDEENQWYGCLHAIISKISKQQKTSIECPKIIDELKCLLREASKTQQWYLFSEAISRLVNDVMKIRSKSQERQPLAEMMCIPSHPTIVIVRALCQLDPKLAFWLADGHCTLPTPFLKASQNSANLIVREMIDAFQAKFGNDESQLLEYLGQEGCDTDKTALCWAIDDQNFELVEALLKASPKLAEHKLVIETALRASSNESLRRIMQHNKEVVKAQHLHYAIESRLHNIVKLILTTRSDIGKELENNTARIIIMNKDIKMWKLCAQFCKNFASEKDCDLLHLAVKLQQVEVVQYLAENHPNLATVKIRDSNSDTDCYALSYNCRDKTKAVQDIRAAIVSAIIRTKETPEIQKILRECLACQLCLHLSDFDTEAHDFDRYVNVLTERWRKRSKQKMQPAAMKGDAYVGERSTSISETDSEEELDEELDRVMKNTNEKFEGNDRASEEPDMETVGRVAEYPLYKPFAFENVIRYASFPELNSRRPNSPDDFRKKHHEITKLLIWLSNKKVEEIIRVKVLDRLHAPHADQVVHYCVKRFRVRSLNWRKLDLYLGGMDPMHSLETLYLYSSGNEGVIAHWIADKGGLRDLRGLKRLYVYIVVDVIGKNRAEKIRMLLQKELEKINEEKTDQEIPAQRRWEKLKIEKFRWGMLKTKWQIPELTEIGASAVPELKTFIAKYQFLHCERAKDEARIQDRKMKPPRRVKVAVIDSGVVLAGNGNLARDRNQEETADKSTFEGNISDRIGNGVSFVHSGADEHPWWQASGPHGTQMTNLICEIDPCCEIYVARVGGLNNSGVTPSRVADAIKWAIAQNVDIISLSLAVYAEYKELHDSVYAANERDIVIICSTADEGNNSRDAFPAKYMDKFDNTIPIVGCNQYGKLLDRSQERGFKYRVYGEDILAGAVPFVTSQDRVTGSSAATAIAAGLASLLLSCYYLAENDWVREEKWRVSAIRKRFDAMTKGSEVARYIQPWKLCGKGSKDDSTEFDLGARIKNEFGTQSNERYRE